MPEANTIALSVPPVYWGVPEIHYTFHAEVDRQGKRVDLIGLPDRSYRCVFYPANGRHRSSCCVYAGRGVYMPILTYQPENDCAVYWYNIGPFRVEFGDCDLLGFSMLREDVPRKGHQYSSVYTDLSKTGGDYMRCLAILLGLVVRDDLWKRKELDRNIGIGRNNAGATA